jgi:hypothetical protein
MRVDTDKSGQLGMTQTGLKGPGLENCMDSIGRVGDRFSSQSNLTEFLGYDKFYQYEHNSPYFSIGDRTTS